MQHHPDKNPDDPNAAQRFQEMAAAHDILSDAQTREMYDEFGMEGLANGGGMEGMDPSDFFADIFGQAGFQFSFGGPSANRRKGQDSVLPYNVTLEDLYNGKHVRMNIEKDAVCSACNGSGAKGNAKPKQCVKCSGKGYTISTTPIGNSTYGQGRTACTDCKGTGEKFREKDSCKKCKGKKVINENKRLEIVIEKGMMDRERIVLAGEGDQAPGIPTGDVIFVLKLAKHDSFERNGNDLIAKVQITLSESILGFSRILLTHLDGRGLRVSSPPNKIIKTGDAITLRGEGMPYHKNLTLRGDLYVVFNVEFPSEDWLHTVDRKTLERILPPKKPELDPQPEIVDDVEYEEEDLVDVRARSFPPGAEFLNQSFASQFEEEGEDAWTDDEDDDVEQPECRTQ